MEHQSCGFFVFKLSWSGLERHPSVIIVTSLATTKRWPWNNRQLFVIYWTLASKVLNNADNRIVITFKSYGKADDEAAVEPLLSFEVPLWDH